MKRGFDLSGVGKKPQHFPQTVWLSYASFKSILELAEQLKVAPNVVCASIIEQYLGQENILDQFKPKKEIIRTAEFRCPFCLTEVQGLLDLKTHILTCEKAKSEFSNVLRSEINEVSQNV